MSSVYVPPFNVITVDFKSSTIDFVTKRLRDESFRDAPLGLARGGERP